MVSGPLPSLSVQTLSNLLAASCRSLPLLGNMELFVAKHRDVIGENALCGLLEINQLKNSAKTVGLVLFWLTMPICEIRDCVIALWLLLLCH